MFGNPATEEWEFVADVEVEKSVEIDFAKQNLTIAEVVELSKTKWKSVVLSNGENIEVSIVWDDKTPRTRIDVRQGIEPVAQLWCDIMDSMIFRTLGGGVVNIQMHG